MAYVSLHNHTCFSIGKALPEPKELLQKAKNLNHSAVAITDSAALIAGWDALPESKKIGIKLIIGCEFYFVDDVNAEQRLRHLILIAKNHVGYKNLLTLSKKGNDHLLIGTRKNYPRIDWKMIEEHKDGLICLTACSQGILGQLICTRNTEEAKKQALRLKEIFGDNLGFEIQPTNIIRQSNAYSDYMDQRLVNTQLIKLGKELNIKIVPTTNCHYLEKDHAEAHDVFMAIGANQPLFSPNRPKYTDEFYFKTEEEVKSYFARLYPKEVDEWLTNTVYFADQCEVPDWIDPKFTNPSGKELPEFPVKDQPDYSEFLKWKENPIYPCSTEEETNKIRNLEEDKAYYRYLVYKGFKCPEGKEKEYHARLQEEFDVIEYHGFSSYMNLVVNILDFARDNDIPTGPGRGSCGGSLSAYFAKIHQLDSIEYDLVFARFHNKEKKSFPDIDNDFSQSGKPMVEQYIKDKYGKDKFAKISNYLTLSPKQYVKGICRSFQYGGDAKSAVAIGQAISDIIPVDTAGKEYNYIDECIEKLPILAEYCKKYKEIQKYAKLIENKPIALGMHPAGVVVGKRSLMEIVPLRKDEDGEIILEFEKERAEYSGLVKLDILGLSTLDIIKSTNNILKSRNKEIPIIDYKKYDQKTYDLISSGNTLCIFQLGTSGGTIDLCKKIKPKSIEDGAIINTLARPHAKTIREPFVATRNGKKKIKYIHKGLERAFSKTLGYPLYEESLLVLVKDIAGWDLNEADRLRKMTKDKGKHPEKEKQIHDDFIRDAQKFGGLSFEMANKIWDQIIANFGLYSFNASHATLYFLTSYHTAYLKAHYPLEFLTANLIFESNSTAAKAEDNIKKIKEEIRALGVKIIPPNINTSGMTCQIIDDNTLMTGFDSLKYMGKDAIPEIIAKRPFTSLEDFLSKVDGRKVRSPAVCALAASGALDEFKLSRKKMFLYAADFKKKVALWQKRVNKGNFSYPWPEDIGEWTLPEKFAMEQKYLGEGLTNDLFKLYPGFFEKSVINFNDLKIKFPEGLEKEDYYINSSVGSLQAVIKSYFEFKVKKEDSKIKGQDMARLTISDPFGNNLDAAIFPKTLGQIKEWIKNIYGTKVKLEPWTAISFVGSVSWYEGSLSLTIDAFRKCAPPPSPPNQLKAEKVTMKIGGRKNSKSTEPEEILEEMEEEMDEQGLSEDPDMFEAMEIHEF